MIALIALGISIADLIILFDMTKRYKSNCKNSSNDNLKKQDNTEQSISVKDAVKVMEKLKRYNGDQIVILETPNGTVSDRLGNMFIYEGQGGELVFDSE